jgi:hypothetical protein
MFEEIVVHDRHIAAHTYQEPFRLFLEGLPARGGSNKGLLVEVRRHHQNRFPLLSALVKEGVA